ncbi:hypothetical protein E1180_21190 [Roseibium denhamense]|uniref:Tat pathway signal sequence domain protein n=1 Tax=Roseibium denhamense TaxID=76305 RepID=A0ABY1NQJ0_9HYPH|nr:hypothetical protein [Roseibium denhamense]MTI08019.1 hypothetical protein [Roseibium denhamense]SMP15594.1 hypothetical protein SAMN06265374_1607 [Roseibium denhamense]
MTIAKRTLAALFFTSALLTGTAASAQQVSGMITMELNQVRPTQTGGCRLSVVATNGLERPIDQLGLEIVAFDKDGLVDQFLRLDFTRISAGKTKVLQFDLSATSCDNLSRLHVNDVLNCVPPAITGVYCPELMDLKNRTDIAFGD